MKLATYQDGSRDGQLIVVSRDLSHAHYANGIATRLQQVLDDWNFLSPQLEELFIALNQGRARHSFAFDPTRCMAPLPRTGQWAEGLAYPSHLERVDGQAPQGLVLRQGAGDDLAGPTSDILVPNEKMGVDLEAGLAVVTGDLPMGVSPERALEGVRLLMLVNAPALRQLNGVSARLSPAFSPVAVTPDELGEAWQGGRLQLPLSVQRNGKRLALCEAGDNMGHHFGQVLAQLASTRRIRAGAVLGSGPVSNLDAGRGHTSLLEKRAVEAASQGEARSDFLRHGDTLRIEVKTAQGASVFGAIEQSVVCAVQAEADRKAKPRDEVSTD